MRYAIDARLNAYRQGGIPQYTRQLWSALAPLAPDDTLITLQHRRQLRPLVVAPNVERATLFTPPHHRFEQLALPLELLPLRLDLIHCPDFIPPMRRPCPAVITVHDLAFLRFSLILDDAARRYYGQIRQAVRSANAVIAVSESTRNDIAELLDFPPANVDVVYEAAAPHFQPRALDPDEDYTINGHTLKPGTFILFVSTLEPRKNVPLLLHALRTCLDRKPAAGYHLVLAGARGWRETSIFETLEELHLSTSVTLLDQVSQEDLLWLYNACRIYVNTSLYEGFGLPVVEALACGAPSLVANNSSLPEVAGEAAILLPANDEEAWADAIERLWHDEAARHDLAQRGPAQAATFSWQRAARETLAIYRRISAQEPT
jgi:glycosyltransferase involved in cell wall biosynthesis